MSFIRNAWYVAAWADEVTREPMVRTILGEPVLLYRTEDGGVVALSDRCPHRFAPMHKGQLEGDVIACPYHGLAFGPDGACVHNPHDDRIPDRARLRAYPVVERQTIIWIWPGDAARAAEVDPPDCPDMIEREDRRTVTGYLKVRSNFSLVTDNLLDLTHSGYLHANSISVPATSGRPEARSGKDEEGVFSRYLTRNVAPPGQWKRFWKEDACDYHRLIRWEPPARLRLEVGVSPVDRPLSEGSSGTGYHLLTPETERSTHYFWTSTRYYDLEPEFDVPTRQFVENAFSNEDEPMIAACQDYMEGEDVFALNPVLLPTDRASVLASRTVKQLLRAEQQPSHEEESASPGQRRFRFKG